MINTFPVDPSSVADDTAVYYVPDCDVTVSIMQYDFVDVALVSINAFIPRSNLTSVLLVLTIFSTSGGLSNFGTMKASAVLAVHCSAPPKHSSLASLSSSE